MARLYPPSVAGTLPSCYEYPTGTVELTVPFSMNKTVAPRQISGFMVRLKTTSTDRVIADWKVDKGQASLEDINPILRTSIPTETLGQLRVGNFYKIQLAYIDTQGIVGYYSSLSIIKFTGKPTVRIADLSTAYTNLDMTAYVGEYFNQEDPTEIVYQYKFLLYNSDGAIIENSGWKIHNSYEDEDSGSSRDTYVIKTALELSKTYRIQYCILTNNKLQINSPRYMICQSDSIDSELKVNIYTDTDYDNGSVTVTLVGDLEDEDGRERVATGTFLIQRSSSSDNFTSWVDVLNFKLTGEFPSNFKFNDFTVEQGETYRYSLQQYNDYGIYSRRILAEDIYVAFEDAFLFDGKRQLRIRYNPKIASFKTTVLDAKKNTIGGKYPLFFRNGKVEYKEFSISGLVTYFMDNEEYFFNKEEIGFKGWEATTDIIDANIYLERQFKLSVLDWLNNGEPKLFRSPQEGNYIVRLMNVTFAPNDSLSRMLHTFTAQANEIADFTSENLAKYNLIQTTLDPIPEMRWRSTNIAQWLDNEIADRIKMYPDKNVYTIIRDARHYARFYDFAEGRPVYYIKIEDAPSGLKIRIGDQEILIGATGYYEAYYEEPLYNLRLSSIEIDDNDENYDNSIPMVIEQGMFGTLTYGTMSTATNTFDTVTSVKVRDIPCKQFFGPQKDLLAEWRDIRLDVQRVYYARFVAKHVEELVLPQNTTIETLQNVMTLLTQENAKDYVYYYTITEENNFVDIFDDITDKSKPNKKPEWESSESKSVTKYYLYYYNGHYLSPIGKGQTQFTDEFEFNGDELIAYAGKPVKKIQQHEAEYAERYSDGIWNSITPYYIYYTREVNPEGSTLNDNKIDWIYTYYAYIQDETSLQWGLTKVDNYSTEVKYHDSTIDVSVIDEYYIPDLDYVPSEISIGSGVYAEIGWQYRVIGYQAEQYCADTRNAWLKAEEAYRVGALNMKKATATSKPSKTEVLETISPCYYFDTEEIDIRLIEDVDRKEYADRDVDIYYYPNLNENLNYNVQALKSQRDMTYQAFIKDLEEYREYEEAEIL